MSDKCIWKEDSDYCMVSTSCGKDLYFEVPVKDCLEDGLKYCGYCGKEIELPEPPNNN